MDNENNDRNNDKKSNGFINKVSEKLVDKSKQNEDDIKDLRNNAKNLSIGSHKESKFED